MTVRTTVHLLRHGEVHNPGGVLYGRLGGFTLSGEGERMAAEVMRALAGHDIVAVVSSPLERALQTAEPMAAQFGLSVRVDDRLVEASNVFEGLTFGSGDGSLRHPSHWWHLRNPFAPSWGEPYADLVARMRAVVEDARDLARGHEAVCVSHQLPIWVFRRAVEGRRLWHRPDIRQCGLASLTSLTWYDDRLVSVTYTEPATPSAGGSGPPGA